MPLISLTPFHLLAGRRSLPCVLTMAFLLSLKPEALKETPVPALFPNA